MSSPQLIQYIKKNNKKVGVLVALKLPDGQIGMGWSKCCKRDQWNRELGLKIALARAVVGDNAAIPRCVQKELDEFTGRVRRYYKLDKE